MTLLYADSVFLQHETGAHPERPARLRPILERLEGSDLAEKTVRPTWEPVARQRLTRVHVPAYVDQVWSLAKSGGGELDHETIVSPCSFDVALSAAGCVCDAVDRILRGEDCRALCLVRPPGHHAMTTHGMGFCLFNNIAIAAKAATEDWGLERVLIVDWDVHHGNGTQATFWEDPRVAFLSIHRWPFYPGTGNFEERGGGDGMGTTLNLPVEFGTPREDYLAIFLHALERFAAKVRPQLVLLSAGFDGHRRDSIGSLDLETEDFLPLTTSVIEVAETYADGNLVSVLEGGYHPETLAECIELHLGELVRRGQPVARQAH